VDIYPSGVITGSQYNNFKENPQNLALIQMGATIVALNGDTGQVSWQWQVPPNVTVTGLSGWGDIIALLAQGEAIQSPYFPTPTTPTVLYAIDAASGATRWVQNATTILPQTQAEAATYAVECFTAGEDYLFYSRASKLAAVNKDGSVAWKTSVSLEGSVGTGQGANITHLIYIPRKPDSDDPVSPRILANANNWSFQRFVLLSLNDTNSSAPAYPLWRSKIPETAMENLFYTQPIVDPWTNHGMFYYWSNRTDWSTGSDVPSWKVMLVGRDLSNGLERWTQTANPVGLPSVFEGRVMVVTADGLVAMQGASGSTIWQIPGVPPTEYSYNVAPTFGNETGLLVASRCLGPEAPSLCMYSAFQPEGAAVRWQGGNAVVSMVMALLVGMLCLVI
jgi:outer membrane protein assembly factor BamB